jgi:competence protein ComFB
MEIVLKNVTEDIVFKKLEQIKDTLEGCKCSRCKLDIIAYALNHLPPKYVITSEGELIAHLEAENTQFDTDLTTLIIQASKIVAANPHHSVN